MSKNTLTTLAYTDETPFVYKDLFIYGAIFISFLFFLVPFHSLMPNDTLDHSWGFVLNAAVGQKLRFGQDIIWTYGPYGSIITRHFHPDTFLLMIAGSVYIAITYSLCIFAIYKRKKDISVIILSLISFLLVHEEILHTSYILLLSFVLIEEPPEWRKNYFVHVLLSASIGLLCLTKLTITYLSLIYIPIIAFSFFRRREYSLGLIYTFVPLITIPTLWIISGQEIKSLLIYFISTRDIVTGYPEGMSTNSSLFINCVYLFFSGYILYDIYSSKDKNKTYKILFLLFFFFSTYKISFTHAFVHEHIAISTPIFVYILYIYFTNRDRTYILLCLTVFILYQMLNIKAQGMVFFATRPGRIGGNAWALKDFYPSKQKDLYDKSVDKLRRELALPPIYGSVDTYSFRQSYFLGHGLNVDFKPIMQGYSAYTPELIRANSQHLIAKKPDNIFVSLEPIFLDGHDMTNIPLLHDGLSFKTLLSSYQAKALIQKEGNIINGDPIEFLHLTRKETPPLSNSLRPIKRQVAFRNEKIIVPPTHNPLFVEINLKKSLWGHGLIFLYKMPQLFMTVTLKNGKTLSYRFVASMAETGFILSPFIETNQELLNLYSSPEKLSGKRVSSFTLRAQNMNWAWLSPYTITWHELPQNSQKEASFTAFNQSYAPLRKMNLASTETLISWVLHTPTLKQAPTLSSFYSRALEPEEPSPWMILKDSVP